MGEGKQIAVTFAQQRAARIVAALLVGAALGLSGAIFQVISGNALGSPDIIGFTNGAATGALLQIIVFNSGPVEVALGAVVGGLATSVLVWLLRAARACMASAWCWSVLVWGRPWRRSMRCWWCVLR